MNSANKDSHRSMSAYDLFGGACRTAGGNKGSYDERWDLTPNQCRQRCDERAADCVAFELMMVGSFELCKLHKDPITNVMKVAGASCSVKARSHALVPFLIAAFSALSHPCGLRTASQVAHPSNPKTLRSKSGGIPGTTASKKGKKKSSSPLLPEPRCCLW